MFLRMLRGKQRRAQQVAVWEWQYENGRWKTFNAAVCQLIERASSNGLNCVCLGDADASLAMFTVYLASMQQKNESSGQLSSVQRRLFPLNAAPGCGVTWQWAGDQEGDWYQFDIDAQCYLEECFQQKRTTVDLSQHFPHLPYVVSFPQMHQVRLCSQFSRSIRRQQGLPYPLVKQSKTATGRKGSLPGLDTTNQKLAVEAQLLASESTVTSFSVPAANASCPSNMPAAANTQVSQSGSVRNHGYSLRSLNCSAPNEDKLSDTTEEGKVDITNLSRKHQLEPKNALTSTPDRRQRQKLDVLKTGQNEAQLKSEKKSSQRSILKRLTAPIVDAIAPLVFPSSSRNVIAHRVSARDCKLQLQSMYIPHPPPMPRGYQQPVDGVKPPSQISICTQQRETVTVETVLEQFTSTEANASSDEECSICYERLSDASGFDSSTSVVSLKGCGHDFHTSCVIAMYNSSSKDGFLQCPICKAIYGEKTGTQPPGTMDYHVLPCSVPGYSDCNTICITYFIPPGIQGPEHPHPGTPFTSRGFPRRCYLPDNDPGRKVLRLLVTAWERRLVFTVGESATTGEQGTVTWNEIHHKTEYGTNCTGHGYPDPRYLDSVLHELGLQGVVE